MGMGGRVDWGNTRVLIGVVFDASIALLRSNGSGVAILGLLGAIVILASSAVFCADVAAFGEDVAVLFNFVTSAEVVLC